MRMTYSFLVFLTCTGAKVKQIHETRKHFATFFLLYLTFLLIGNEPRYHFTL